MAKKIKKEFKNWEGNIRPWGNYQVIEKRKILTINPHSRLSLQYHNHRDEFWSIISGEGKIIIGNKEYNAKEGDTFNVPKKTIHRIITEKSELVVLEIATGEVYEDDIVRLEDDYHRELNQKETE